jgi:hypothetical protein
MQLLATSVEAIGRDDRSRRSVEAIRRRIEGIYRAHNPRKLGSVKTLLAEWAGEEPELLAQIEAKYLPL